MKVYEKYGTTVIDMGTFKLRIQPLDENTLDLNLIDNRMSCMKVIPQAGNVIRISPDRE